jgi:hypothetical protein
MIFKMTFILSFLLSLTAFLPCFADPSLPCSDADWTAPPTLQNGIFDGTLKATCALSGGQNIGIKALEEHFLDQAKQVKKMISAPSAEKYDNLDSSLLKVETELGKLDILADEHVASDGHSRAVYSLVSSQVNASFPEGMTKALDILIDVRREGDSAVYQLAMTVHIQVKKPGWIPGAGFESASESISKTVFKEQSANQVGALQKLL